MRETTASAAAANWRYAHLQMLKGIGKGVDRGPKTKHMTKITLNVNVVETVCMGAIIGAVETKCRLLSARVCAMRVSGEPVTGPVELSGCGG